MADLQDLALLLRLLREEGVAQFTGLGYTVIFDRPPVMVSEEPAKEADEKPDHLETLMRMRAGV